jgi:hypothetical protein
MSSRVWPVELWRQLARGLESAPPDANIVKLLEKRFNDHLADPSQAASAEKVFERLAERKQPHPATS